MVVHYKCPNCGADMGFDTHSGKLKCDSCSHEETIEKMTGLPENTNDEDISYDADEDDVLIANSGFEDDYEDSSNEDNPSDHTTFSNNEVLEYNCDNCGAVILTDPQTSATKCSFCGAGVVISDRLSGSFTPKAVIPFSISKEQAQVAFKKWCKKGLLTPNDFRVADRVKDITGIYIPFWLFDINAKGEVEAVCTTTRRYTSGDWIYKETKYYNVYRKIDLNYLKIPTDASKKMNDKMMDKLEPYSFTSLKDFKMPYLVGYIAEKYDFDDETLLPRVKARVTSYADSYIRSTITGYSTVSINRKDINIRKTKSDYALLPVWMVCYDYKQSEHNFLMNGQTGKIAGKPPISGLKVASWFLGVSGASLLALRLITLMAGGSFLW